MSEAFTFRGHLYTLTESEQKVTIKGPWMPCARKLFTRRCRGKTTASPIDETAADMLVRVEFDAAKYEVSFAAHLSALRAQRALTTLVRAQRDNAEPPPSTSYTTPNASPASQRSLRSHGESGKPSPESVASWEAPPRTKRPQPAPPARARASSRGARQQHATGAMHAPDMQPPPPRQNAGSTGRASSLGQRQHMASVAARAAPGAARAASTQPRTSTSGASGSRDVPMEERVALLPPLPRMNAWMLGPPRIAGLRSSQASTGAHTAVPTSPRLGGPTDVKGSPSVIAAANVAAVALSYVSPKTDPQQRMQPPVTRAAQSQGRGDVNDRPPTLEERMAALAPRGRIQRKVWLTEEEKQQLKTALKRERRAQDRRLQEVCGVLMATLARYDLALVQLQLAEYAADPSNLGTAGSMRKLFLALYACCCHTKHVDPVHDVLDLPVLAAVLKRFKPARGHGVSVCIVGWSEPVESLFCTALESSCRVVAVLWWRVYILSLNS